MSLLAKNITVQRDGHRLVSDLSITLKPGTLTIIIGPNGAGKSMTLRAMVGLEPIESGAVTLNGQSVHQMKAPDRARHVAYLPQSRPLAWPQRVYDLVALGRFAYGTNSARLSDADESAVDKAIRACHLTDLQKRSADTLSGGELARVHMARALASEAPYLVADEPIASLDPYHQLQILDVLKSYCTAGGTALIVVHDMALAARYADQLICLKGGHMLASGQSETILTPPLIADLFNVSASLQDGYPMLHSRLGAP